MNSLNFGKDTAKDKYEEFLQHYLEYLNDDLSVLKAKQVAISAWHLTDWTHKESEYSDLGNFRELLYVKCQSLKVMHDLTNASKHRILTSPKGDIKNTKEHKGDFSRDFNSDFDISYLQIEKNDGNKLSFIDEIKNVKEFWDAYFKDK